MPQSPQKKLPKLAPDTALMIADALTAYASAAYPVGGSECSQATHQTLLDLAKKIIIEAPEGKLALKKRQLPIIKAALKWYYSEQNTELTGKQINPENLLKQLK